MEQSLFFEYIAKYFPSLVLRTVEKLNDKNQTALTYMFKDMLTKKYSVDGRWSSVYGMYNRVAADVVAMDSSIPLKTRDSLSKASGDIVKIAMELALNEKQMSDIDAMIGIGVDNNQIIAKILEDTPRVIEGVYERLELMFLQGLSTGIALAEDPTNVGTGVRLNYGYMPENQFGVSVLWNTPTTSLVLDDITKVNNKATNDGNALRFAYTDSATFGYMVKSKQFKDAFVLNNNFVGEPSLSQVNSVFSDKFGFTLTKVDRVVKTEKNGNKTSVKPWKDGTIVFTSDKNVGSLVWTRLAEMTRLNPAGMYQFADDYIMVSKFMQSRPSFAEFTSSQARVVPVISNVDRIYTLDTKTVQA